MVAFTSFLRFQPRHHLDRRQLQLYICKQNPKAQDYHKIPFLLNIRNIQPQYHHNSPLIFKLSLKAVTSAFKCLEHEYPQTASRVTHLSTSPTSKPRFGEPNYELDHVTRPHIEHLLGTRQHSDPLPLVPRTPRKPSTPSDPIRFIRSTPLPPLAYGDRFSVHCGLALHHLAHARISHHPTS